MNSPTITAISLTAFFTAYPSKRPPKKPPPIPAETETKLSHECEVSLLTVVHIISTGYPMYIVLFKYIPWISIVYGD
jgi:hypothetical protein